MDQTVIPVQSLATILVCLVTTAVALTVALLTRSITFYGPSTDNQTQVRTAATAEQWRFPSDMHKIMENGLRSRMKDGHILGLVVIQRLLRDRTSDYPTVILCLVTNSVSAIMVYLIASNYWNTGAGLLVWALLLTCLWPHQLALFGTHILTANMFFLISVYFLQQAEPGLSTLGLASYFAAGLVIAVTMFSSGSSRKYLPLVAGAVIYSQRTTLWFPDTTWLWDGPFSSNIHLSLLAVAAALAAGAFVILATYKNVVAAMYSDQAPRWISRLIPVRDEKYDARHYVSRATEYISSVINLFLITAVYLIVSLMIVNSDYFYLSQLVLLAGVGSMVLILTFPNVTENVWGYYKHSQGWKRNRFPMYEEYFSSLGMPINKNMRGGGIQWILRFFSRIAPGQFAAWLGCFSTLIALFVFGEIEPGVAWEALAILLLSLSPVIMGEVTHSAQSSRFYYPGLVGILMFVGYVAFQVDQSSVAMLWRAAFWSMAGISVLTSAVWTIWMFFDDVLPARMAPARLGQTLQTLGIDEFYTYDSPYNDAFVNSLAPEVRTQYTVNHIKSLNEVKSGYVAVPGTSSKALNMESVGSAIDQGDFQEDSELNRLLESKEIKKYAIASFKTFGTSRIWHQEAEITSYRDLILGQVGDADRWRGRAWILDAGKLHAVRNNR